MLVLVLLMELLRWEPEVAVGDGQGSRPNKLVGRPLDPDLGAWCCAGEVVAPIWPLFFSHQGGGEGEWWRGALSPSAWQEAAVFHGVHQLGHGDASVILGRRDLSLLRCRVFCNVFNLQASVPMWRPFSDSITSLSACPSSSGSVPDGGAGGRDVEFFVFFGGEGLDCILQYFVRVPFANVEDLLVFSFSHVVLLVRCKPTV
jgi:hypothetical protein